MPLGVCYSIAYIQVLSAGYNLWGVDPRIIASTPVGRNTVFVGLFLLVQLLGLAGAVLMLQRMRLGFILSITHHILLLPALVITGWGLVMLMDDKINATLLFMSRPTGFEVGFFWSLGWGTVFQQVTRNVPVGSNFIGVNLFALSCAWVLWTGMSQSNEAKAEREMQARRRPRQGRPRQLALPAPPAPQRMQPQQNRMRPPQAARQPSRARSW